MNNKSNILLNIKNLKAYVLEKEDNVNNKQTKKEILKGINLKVTRGEIVAIMGPNGSGKSTLSNVIMGNNQYKKEGDIIFEGEDIIDLNPEEISKKGIFLSFQHPISIPGLKINTYLRAMLRAQLGKISLRDFKEKVNSALEKLKLNKSILERYLNDGFSGGEKKKLEMLQMLLLNPKLSILDETDSGLDIDALNIVSNTVNSIKTENNSFLIITHYSRILNLIKPHKIYILMDGKIVYMGDSSLVDKLEKEGYNWLK